MLFNLSEAWAQSAEPRTAEGQIEIKPLKIGDTIPEELWNLPMQVVNHPTGKDTITLNDYRDKKLIILDFWATWCAPCIAMMPKIDSLQDTYDKNIQFIGATNEGREVVSTFFKRRNKIQDTNRSVVFVTNERLLTQYFPHGSIPHYIWFDSEGKVLALTGTESVNKEIIQKLLNGENLSLEKKEDFHLPLDNKKPFLFKEDALYGGDIIFQRTLTGYIDGAGAGYVQTIDIDDNDSPYIQGPYRRISARNLSIVQLYQLAFSDRNQYFHWHNTEIRSKDKQKLKTESKGAAFVEWMKAGNTFCYELIISENQRETARSIMKEDLKRQFPKYTATVEQKIVASLCLVRTSKVDKISSTDSARVLDLGPFGGRVNGYSLAYFLQQLHDKGLQGYQKPVIDLTGYNGVVDIEIQAKLTDLKEINVELKKYDLEIIEQDQTIAVLVIDDVDGRITPKEDAQ